MLQHESHFSFNDNVLHLFHYLFHYFISIVYNARPEISNRSRLIIQMYSEGGRLHRYLMSLL